jgi:anti-sigma-K factor RskA
MNCDERADLLLYRSLTPLSDQEQSALVRCLAEECPPREQVHGEVDATLAHIAGGLAGLTPSPRARAAFLGRLTQRSRAPTVAAPALASSGTGMPQPRPSWRWLLAGALPPIIALVVVMALLQQKDSLVISLHGQLDESNQALTQIRTSIDGKTKEVATQIATLERLLSQAQTQLTAHQNDFSQAESAVKSAQNTEEKFRFQVHALSRQLTELATEHQALTANSQRASELLALLPNPHVRIIDLIGTNRQSTATGCVLWDPDTNLWHLITINLAPLPIGQRYQFWFVTATHQRLSGGTFTPDAKGTGSIASTVPADSGRIASFEVTDEPAQGSAKPTGAIQLTSLP